MVSEKFMDTYTPNEVAGMISAYEELRRTLDFQLSSNSESARQDLEGAVSRYEENIPPAVRNSIWSGGGNDLLKTAKGRLGMRRP